MNLDEYIVLEALNVASTQYRRPGHDFEATAAQIAEVLNTDDRFWRERRALGDGFERDARWVGGKLRQLHKGMPVRRAPLVQRVSTRRWRLTEAALHALNA